MQGHLDNEMDDYWKDNKQAKQGAAQNDVTKSSSYSVDTSMVMSLKDIAGASPHHAGLNLMNTKV